MKKDFNRDWTFAKSETLWPSDFLDENNLLEPVILPHTWNEDDMTLDTADSYVGGGWYGKSFFPPELQQGQRLLIEFEGVTNCHKVWVNGGYAGGRNGGFLSTVLDVTDLLIEGENSLLVRADNSYDITAAMPMWIDWNRYGGITRPVWLYVRSHAFITCAGVSISTPSVTKDTARTVVQTRVEESRLSGSELTIRHTLIEPGGEILSETVTALNTRFSVTNSLEVELPVIKNPQLWSDVNPQLYTVRTEILEANKVLDTQTDRVGYRYYHFDADQGFILNGMPTKLLGANIHIFFPGLGSALPERFHTNDMKLMKEMGCNYMRTSHYPRPKSTLDACDELGILVLEEQPYWHGSLRASGGEEALDNAPRLLRDMVRHHGSHPSIIAWNTVNEVMLAPAFIPGEGHLEPTDPRRKAWSINRGEFPYIRRHLQIMVDTLKEIDPDRPVSMVVGAKWDFNDEAGLTSMADLVAYNGGAMNFTKEPFIGPKTGKTYEFKPDYFRELYPERKHLMSEGILNDVEYKRGDWNGEEAAWKQSARYWNTIYKREWFCGGSMWCFTDYTANGNFRLHGVVDRFRLPKDLFYFYQSQWADQQVLHILGHWNHEPDSMGDVVVFTNGDDIELFLNGRSLGEGTSTASDYDSLPHAPLIWKDIPYEEGKIEVRGQRGGLKMEDSRIRAGKPNLIKLTAANDLLGDGRDISYIDITLCDDRGNRCYTSGSSVTLTVQGPARLGGSSTVKLTAGLGRSVIRSLGEAGQITVTAEAPGLTGGKIKVAAFL